MRLGMGHAIDDAGGSALRSAKPALIGDPLGSNCRLPSTQNILWKGKNYTMGDSNFRPLDVNGV